MLDNERRRRRSHHRSEALFYQLDASRERAELDAMILADQQGLCVAAVGDQGLCETLAAHLVRFCQDTNDYEGGVSSPTTRWEVHMRGVSVADEHLVLCAVGGDAARRARELGVSAAGVSRILGA